MEQGPVRLAYPGRRTRIAARISKGLVLVLLAVASSVIGIPLHLGGPSSQGPPGIAPDALGWQSPRGIGADSVPDLALPRTEVSTIDKVTGTANIIQVSRDNLIVYNPGVALRILGGALPHDELLGANFRVLSPWTSWSVEAQTERGWTPPPT